MSKSVKVREKWIDNAKGIAMILVIAGHVSEGLTGILNFGWVYGVHLVMFFLLSGFTLKKKPLTKEYVNRKFVRLMIPYFWTCLAVSFANIWNSWYFSKDISISTISNIIGKDILISFFASGAITTFGTVDIGARIGAIWFLPALFFAVLIFELLINYKDDDIFLGVSTGAIAIIACITAKFIWFPFSIQSGMFASFFIWLGYEIKKHAVLEKIKWYNYAIALIVLWFGIHFNYCNIGFVIASMPDPWISIAVGVSGCLLIYLISLTYKGNLLSYIGRISLTVLCVHLFALNTLQEYYGRIFDKFALQGNVRIWANIVINVVFAIVTAAFIELTKNIFKSKHEYIRKQLTDSLKNESNDLALYIEQGIFVSLLVVGQFPINERLRTIIYSCNTAVFIFFAGYCNGQREFNRDLIFCAVKKYLTPYFVTAIIDIAFHHNAWHSKFIKYCAGISNTNQIFTDVQSVGPVYIFLVLFLCVTFYAFITRYLKDNRKIFITVLCISVLGLILGNIGLWLPWSMDIVCYSLVIYYIGILFKERDILNYISKTYASYFLLSSMWACMIYDGGMELSTRNYGQYGFVIMGAISGIIVTYQLSQYIERNLPILSRLLLPIGMGFTWILTVYTIIHEKVEAVIAGNIGSSNVVYCGLVVFIEFLLGLIIIFFVNFLKVRQLRYRQ